MPFYAQAIPPSQFLVGKAALIHQGFHSVQVVSEITGLEGGRPSDVTFKDVTTYDSKKRMLRSRGLDLEGREIYTSTTKLSSAYEDRASIEIDAIVTHLLHDTDIVAITQALLATGVPIRLDTELEAMADEAERRAAERTHLRRWKQSKRAAWIIGERPGEISSPQLWVEKDMFHPLRFLNSAIDIQFDTFRFDDGYVYPAEIIVARGVRAELPNFTSPFEPVLRARLIKIQSMSAAPSDGTRTSQGLTEAGRAASTPLQELIQLYYQVLR